MLIVHISYAVGTAWLIGASCYPSSKHDVGKLLTLIRDIANIVAMFIQVVSALETPHVHDRVSVQSLGPEQWLYLYGHPRDTGQLRVPCAVVQGTGAAYPMPGGALASG